MALRSDPHDLSSMWNRRLREMARAAEIYACPYCPERKIFHQEPRLFDHVHAEHSDRIPSNDAEMEAFREELKARAREKGGNGVDAFRRKADLQSNPNPVSKPVELGAQDSYSFLTNVPPQEQPADAPLTPACPTTSKDPSPRRSKVRTGSTLAVLSPGDPSDPDFRRTTVGAGEGLKSSTSFHKWLFEPNRNASPTESLGKGTEVGDIAGYSDLQLLFSYVDAIGKQVAAAQQAARQSRLNDEQWQALIGLHRTLPHEHDFFIASQHARESVSQACKVSMKSLSPSNRQHVHIQRRRSTFSGTSSMLNSCFRLIFLAMLVCSTTALTCLEQSVVTGQLFSGAVAGLSGYALLGYQGDPRVPVLQGWVFGAWGITLPLFLLFQSYWILPEKRLWYIIASLMLSAVLISIVAPAAGFRDGIATYGPLFTVVSAIFTYVPFPKREQQPGSGRQDIEALRANTDEDISLSELHGGSNAPVGGQTHSQDEAERRNYDAIATSGILGAPVRAVRNTMHDDRTTPPTYHQAIDPLTAAFPSPDIASGPRHVQQPHTTSASSVGSGRFRLAEDNELRSLAESSGGQPPAH